MSFWSNVGSTFGSLIKTGASALDKFAGNTGAITSLGEGISSLAGRAQAQSDLNDARNWQMYTQQQANQFAHDEAQLARDFNSVEAQKNRDFESLEADKARQQSRQWQLEDWERETAYNSPANQLRLMQEAGINPLLFNESVSNQGMPSAISPSSPSGSAASSSPAVSSMASLAIPNPSLISAQTRLANAQADKAESDVDVNKETANRIRSLLAGELQEQNCRILTSLSDIEVNKATAKKLVAESVKIDAEVVNLQQELLNMQQLLSNLQSQGKLTEKEIEAIDKRLYNETLVALSEVNKNNASARLSEEEIRHIASQITTEKIQQGILNLDWGFQRSTQNSRIVMQISSNMRDTMDNYVDMGKTQGVSFWQVTRGIMRGCGSALGGAVKTIPMMVPKP